MAAFEDEFTSATDTLLQDHDPDVGTAWTWNGTAGQASFSIDADVNAIYAGGIGGNYEIGYYTIDPPLSSADQQAWGQRYAFEVSAVLVATPAVRVVDENNWYGIKHVGTGSSGLRLVRVVAGNDTELIQAQGADSEWLRIKAEGTTISMWRAAAGAEPTDPGADTNWTQVGADQTGQTDHQTEVDCGLAAPKSGGDAVPRYLRNFRADVYPVAGGTDFAAELTTVTLGTLSGADLDVLAAYVATLSAATLEPAVARDLSVLQAFVAGLTTGTVQPLVGHDLTYPDDGFVVQLTAAELAGTVGASLSIFAAYVVELTTRTLPFSAHRLTHTGELGRTLLASLTRSLSRALKRALLVTTADD